MHFQYEFEAYFQSFKHNNIFRILARCPKMDRQFPKLFSAFLKALISFLKKLHYLFFSVELNLSDRFPSFFHNSMCLACFF